MDIVQGAGYLIIAFAAAQAAIMLVAYGARVHAQRQVANADLELFRERASILLKRTASECEKSELSWNGKRKFVVARRVYENPAQDICSFYLTPHDKQALPPFEPGQFLTFELPVPGQPSPIVRCYSLSQSAMVRDSYRVSIKKLGPPPKAPEGTPPGLSSNYFHNELTEGSIVEVMAPGGAFYLDQESDRPVVLIGGGVGLTPVFSMMETLVDSGSSREIWFYYGVRNRAEHAMMERIQQIGRENPNVHVVICYSDPTDTCIEGEHYTVHGRVSVDLFKSQLPSNNYEFYICGPPPMMESVTSQLEEWGVPEEDIHFEAFGPATVKKSHEAPPVDAATAFSVTFSRSRKTLDWRPQSGSLLEFAEENGLKINSGCRSGGCGTCLTAIKEGEVEYLHKPGKKPEAGSCLVCIARPKGTLVLEA
jgi:ferredoxin-NADP reductase